MKSRDFDTTVLFGEDIYENGIPAYTADYRNNPLLVFPGNNCKPFGFNEWSASRHLLTLGGIGTGKTNVFNFMIEKILRDMTDDDVVVIFDTKGDFHDNFYEPDNPNHIVIGNHPKYIDETSYWNIFDDLRNSKGEFDHQSGLILKEMTFQFFEGQKSEMQPFFANAARALVNLVIEDDINYSPVLNNKILVDHLRNYTHKDYLEVIGRSDDRSAVNYIGANPNSTANQSLGVLGTIGAMVDTLFANTIFEQSHSSRNISMRKLIREKGSKVIFIEYDLSVGETLGPIYSILLDLVFKEALSREKKQGNVYCFIDEFKLLPQLKHIDDALNFGRSLGIKMFCGLQSVNQIIDNYGEAKAKAMLSGFRNVFAFNVDDSESRQFIKERFGQTFVSVSYRPFGETTTLQREGYVVEDWDIVGLETGQAFVKMDGQAPFYFPFLNFNEDHY
ncbi:MAG: type IV secretion system DNA-binding domain-containing protein [Erysipelotrichaceae bacterium]|nr:type IV secretion system DNA-binding domain-containing protein [Erysipelotrichaceae bacterium]